VSKSRRPCLATVDSYPISRRPPALPVITWPGWSTALVSCDKYRVQIAHQAQLLEDGLQHANILRKPGGDHHTMNRNRAAGLLAFSDPKDAHHG